MRQFFRRLLYLFQRRRLEAELTEEMAFHREQKEAEFARNGCPVDNVASATNRVLGSVTLARERSHEVWVWLWLEHLIYDIRFALRGLRRDWSSILAAITMLALAIGLNVTAFTVMSAMVFRGAPLVHRSDRLVYIQVRRPVGAWSTLYTDFEAWRAQAHSFEGLACTGTARTTVFRDSHGHHTDVSVGPVTANNFGLLGVHPMLGRDFVDADEAPDAAPVVILSYQFWESRLGKPADILGSVVRLGDESVTVIGIMPRGFQAEVSRLWEPLGHGLQLRQKGFSVWGVFGRLRDGSTLQEARAEIETINSRQQIADPTTERPVVPSVLTYSQASVGPDAPLIYGSLWMAAWFVLLIACANLANLTLARTIGRWHDLVTRMALGGGRWRIARQVVIENVLLASLAGVLGWYITIWSVQQWAAMTASSFLVVDFSVDAGVVTYLAGVSVAAAILCSVAPVIRVLRMRNTGLLTGAGRGVFQGRSIKRVVRGLVAAQMALAIVLLAGAGVLVRSLLSIVNADRRVRDPEHVLVGTLRFPSDKYPVSSTLPRLSYFEQLESRVKTIAGVEQVSVASSLPVNVGALRAFDIEGMPNSPGDTDQLQFLSVDSNYFQLVGAATIAGREFNDRDRMSAIPVVIVNQAFATRFWPGESALGKRVRPKGGNQVGAWYTVVGVVTDVGQLDYLRERFSPLVYVPYGQPLTAYGRNNHGVGFNGATFLVRVRVPPKQAAPAVRAEVQRADPDVFIEEFGTLRDSFGFVRDRMDLAHAELGSYATVAPVYAGLALFLTAIGLYAVVAHSVGQRTKEIGIRMAIGAVAGDVRAMILREGMMPVALGMVVGLSASFEVNHALRSQLVGVSPYDPVTMTGAPLLLILVALLACQVPVRRAVRVDPVVALRHD
jgi:putative ABC transport system permease protein